MTPEEKRRPRSYERLTCNLEALLNGSLPCTAFDISEGGMYVHTDAAFKPGSVISVSLPFREDRLELKVRVKHVEEGVGAGLMFIDLDDALKAKIRLLIQDIAGPS